MIKWFIADTHFSHSDIIRYASRPYANVEEMDRNLIDNWNQSVGKDDQVFFLGDFGLGDVNHLHSICSRLNGQKVCIRGNHDRNASKLIFGWSSEGLNLTRLIEFMTLDKIVLTIIFWTF